MKEMCARQNADFLFIIIRFLTYRTVLVITNDISEIEIAVWHHPKTPKEIGIQRYTH
jgi:hypothetical protein